MKIWKQLLLGIIFVFIYAIGFMWIYGWIFSIVFSIIFIVLLFIPYGGTIIDYYNNIKSKMKKTTLNENMENRILHSSKERIPHIAIALSGGVDSAVSAFLLKDKGYKVTAYFMRNWDSSVNNELNHIKSKSDICEQEKDYNDAKLVADFLNIPLKRLDFVDDYWKLVFQEFLNDLKMGVTPNPDITCNKEIKFGKFINKILKDDNTIDFIATGHYASISYKSKNYLLSKAFDKTKDQTYFLSELDPQILKKVIFPLSAYTKKEVRDIAKKENIPVANKKDSMGICFIGERNFKEFISNYIDLKPGKIIDIKTKKIIGEHQGALLYTNGQSKGLNLGGQKERFYVHSKDIQKNLVYVTNDNPKENINLYGNIIKTNDFNLMGWNKLLKGKVRIKIRHSVELHNAKILEVYRENNSIKLSIKTKKPLKAISPGQELVLYKKDICIGGGKISNI